MNKPHTAESAPTPSSAGPVDDQKDHREAFNAATWHAGIPNDLRDRLWRQLEIHGYRIVHEFDVNQPAAEAKGEHCRCTFPVCAKCDGEVVTDYELRAQLTVAQSDAAKAKNERDIAYGLLQQHVDCGEPERVIPAELWSNWQRRVKIYKSAAALLATLHASGGAKEQP